MVKNREKASNTPKRKIVLFIVEGPSDREALKPAISELYDRIDPEIDVVFAMIQYGEQRGGDITCLHYEDRVLKRTNSVVPEYIAKDIYEVIIKPLNEATPAIYPKYLSEIVHIVDLDGAYIPTEAIEENAELGKPSYQPDKIICPSKENIINRNEQKTINLDYLSSLEEIKIKTTTVPYRVYYFSSNLDHFLHYDANMDDNKKMSAARAFADSKADVDSFVKYFSEDPASAREMSYEESWQFIKKGTNSLARRTNIDILLKKLHSSQIE